MSQCRIEVLKNHEAEAYLTDVANLRIKIFREYPYLYEGNISYEKEYLRSYIDFDHSVVIVAKDGEKIVGAITGVPCEVRQCYLKNQKSLEDRFYIGELVLLKKYRGKGIGSKLYQALEDYVQSLKTYKKLVFCEIVKKDNDPKRPSDYFCLDEFWAKQGYIKKPELVTYCSWRKLGEVLETASQMVFWEKDL